MFMSGMSSFGNVGDTLIEGSPCEPGAWLARMDSGSGPMTPSFRRMCGENAQLTWRHFDIKIRWHFSRRNRWPPWRIEKWRFP